MTLFLVVLSAVLILILLSFVIALKIIFTFNTDKSKMNLTLLWLYPFVKAVITNEVSGLVLTVYLLKKSIFRRPLKRSGNSPGNLDLISRVKPRDVNINASYGFRDPFLTGVACGAIGIVSQLINIGSIKQNPEFVTDSDYIYVDATAKVNLGPALVNMFRAYRNGAGRKKSYA